MRNTYLIMQKKTEQEDMYNVFMFGAEIKSTITECSCKLTNIRRYQKLIADGFKVVRAIKSWQER